MKRILIRGLQPGNRQIAIHPFFANTFRVASLSRIIVKKTPIWLALILVIGPNKTGCKKRYRKSNNTRTRFNIQNFILQIDAWKTLWRFHEDKSSGFWSTIWFRITGAGFLGSFFLMDVNCVCHYCVVIMNWITSSKCIVLDLKW